MEALFHTDLNTAQSVLTGPALDDASTKLVGATRSAVGDDVSLLANGADISGHEARYCEVAATLLDRLAALPLAEAAPFARGLRATTS